MSNKLRLLVVDDEQTLLQILKIQFEQAGFEVETAEDGDVALNLLERNHYDLMTLGIKMPRVDGLTVLRGMKSLSDRPQVIMLSGFADLKTAKECLELGARDFVSKPFEWNSLFGAIERVLGSENLRRNGIRFQSQELANGQSPQERQMDQDIKGSLGRKVKVVNKKKRKKAILMSSVISFILIIVGVQYLGTEKTFGFLFLIGAAAVIYLIIMALRKPSGQASNSNVEQPRVANASYENSGSWIIYLILLAIPFGCTYWALHLDEQFDRNLSRQVENCLGAIEERNWDDYRATIEPSAIINATSPGSPIHFISPKVSILKQGEKVSTVRLDVFVGYEGIKDSLPFTTVLELVKVNRSGWEGTMGLKSWYLTKADVELLPFAF